MGTVVQRRSAGASARIAIAIGSVVVLSCSQDGPEPPVLAVSPARIQFERSDSSAALEIQNAGGGTLRWDLQETIPWLAAVPTSGEISNAQHVDLIIVSDSLAVGPVGAALTVGSNGGGVAVPVAMQRALTTAPTELPLGLNEHGEVAIANASDDPLDWRAVSLNEWLIVSPEAGTLASTPQMIAVSVRPSGLPPGDHVGRFVVSAGALGLDSVRVRISIPQVASVSGTVYFRSTRIPVPQAIVTIGAIGDTTGVDGSYRLVNVPTGTRVLRAEREGFTAREEDVLVPEEGVILDLWLETPIHAHRLAGVVRNALAEPVANATCALENPDGSLSEISARTAADGSYALDSVPEGLRAVRSEHPLYEPSTDTTNVANDTVFDPVLVALPVGPPYLLPPGRRLDLTAIGCYRVLVGWPPRAESTVGGYRIERGRSADGLFREIGRVVGGQTTTFADEVPDFGRYNYRVRTENIDGLTGDPTDPEYSHVTLRVWTELNDGLTQDPSPHERWGHSCVVDARRNRLIMFAGVGCESGQCGIDFNDTWALDLDTRVWSLLDPGTGPGDRYGHAAILDAPRDRMVIFGGILGTSQRYYNDTWAYDLSSDNPRPWTRLHDGGSGPAARYGHAGIYSGPSGDHLIIYGGHTPGQFLNDVWAFDLAAHTWTQLLTGQPGERNPQPQARSMQAAVHDSRRDRMVFYGGRSLIRVFGDCWSLDLESLLWTRLADGPGERYASAWVYDETGDRMIVAEGRADGETFYDDLQSLSLGDAPAWSPLDSGGEYGPSIRYSHSAALDGAGNRILMFGGLTGGELLQDTWSYCLVR